MQFFSQKSKIFANYSTIHAKQIILKAKHTRQKSPPLQMWVMWAE
ncbi:hypothetical protein HCCG_00287 [Helicobacter cinaedi CCUG 18818 = ATCC BAA-847]|uniref:Uncharacterized protein n=1 Tax=Helicobacter cinaedi CCUG 18818 = ATCC BAA-847 TaxID=537971 RepID=A0ABN0B873_9HELI|nr:hypothetical protein HCCG_00287 [Helicobacter cinaedi CCUG 18818 = ATCC BAA-847]